MTDFEYSLQLMYKIPRNVYIIVGLKNIYVYMYKTIACLHFCDKRAFVI